MKRRVGVERPLFMVFRISEDEEIALALATQEALAPEKPYRSIYVRKVLFKDKTMKKYLKQIKAVKRK